MFGFILSYIQIQHTTGTSPITYSSKTILLVIATSVVYETDCARFGN